MWVPWNTSKLRRAPQLPNASPMERCDSRAPSQSSDTEIVQARGSTPYFQKTNTRGRNRTMEQVLQRVSRLCYEKASSLGSRLLRRLRSKASSLRSSCVERDIVLMVSGGGIMLAISNLVDGIAVGWAVVGLTCSFFASVIAILRHDEP